MNAAAIGRRAIQIGCLGLFVGLFFYVAWPYAEAFSSRLFADKERIPAELFLWVDPLVGLSSAIAARNWNIALVGLLAIAALCVVVPRAFCGYICPLGTLIDGFDWLIGRHFRAMRLRRRGWWVHLRYYLLIAVLAAAVMGVMLAGHVAAIPVLTRGVMFTAGRLQVGMAKNWGLIFSATPAVYVAIGLFVLIFLLGLLAPRFWCRYVCPSGAIFSLFSHFRMHQRRLATTCNACGKCRRNCPFDAIDEDHQARPLDCTFCQTCAGVCPTGSVKFGRRTAETEASADAPTAAVSRRGLLAGIAGGAVCAVGIRPTFGQPRPLIRPPGSVAEREFLQLCVRCGECFKVCPGSVLQPAGIQEGLDALWTPIVVPTQAGCHADCNFCSQVCPTRAIRPLTIDHKRKARIGLAIIDVKLCLPYTGEKDCKLCYDECEAAGYHAIQMKPIRLPTPDRPPPGVSEEDLEEMSRIDAPHILADACVGCGLCEYRCHSALVKREKRLVRQAVTIKPDLSRR